MRDIVRIGLLFDFYEELLTERQRTVMGFYLNENFSLAEISEEINISRQGVHDIIKRTTLKLESFERKLSLCKKLSENRKISTEIIKSLKIDDSENIRRKLKIIVEG